LVTSTAVRRAPEGGWPSAIGWKLIATGVAVLAFVARLVPVLRGGGLFGLGDYDDGVHYSAASGLVHGQLPYRDFLFLQPPGIVLALTPFAALGRLVGDPMGFAAARVAWMGLGAVNALLVVVILRRRGRAPAMVGGICYALFPPAVYGEHSTQLEGLATICILVAVLLLAATSAPRWQAILAGALLGVSSGVKIWGVVALAIAGIWAVAAGGSRRAVAVAAGGVAGAAVVCLPFFLVAPSAMARMVVMDQLDRPEVHASPVLRLNQILGLPGHPNTPSPLLIAVLVVWVVVTAYAWMITEARLAVALLVSLAMLLMLTPSWFLHYAALVAGPAAVTAGSGAAQLVERARHLNPRLAGVAVIALSLLVAGYATPTFSARYGTPFPGSRLAVAVQNDSGCVTTDDPTTLVEMNVLRRNFDRRCPLVVDLGGNSYDQLGVTPVPRARNAAWQRYAVTYLRTGSVVVIARFSTGRGFSPATAALVSRWRVLERVGRYAVRQVNDRS
jgi:alpha-1,2-mannosyltransferase